MNDHDTTDIEARLGDLQPANPDPALRQRIASSLETGGTEQAAPFHFPKPLAYALAAAACVVLAAVLWVVISHNNATPPIAVDPDPTEMNEATDPEPPAIPTPHTARLALLQSPESLDQALDALLEVPSGGDADSTPLIYTFADGWRLTHLETLP